jgi:voltage-gated sodium channel
MVESCKRLVESRWFQNAVLGLIIVNALVMGLETWPALAARWAGLFRAMNGAVQGAFLVEITLRLVAHGSRPHRFFQNGWNVFDFTVVALSLLPAAGPFATVARLARILRVGRLVSGMPDLRLIIGTMLKSIPSMGHVVMLLSLLIYVYGVTGHHLFGAVDPDHWGTLGRAAQTLFFVITLEGWIEIMKASEPATPWAWVYYVSFIIIAVFVVTNLFIAVVINNLEKVRSEEASASGEPPPVDEHQLLAEVRALGARIDRLSEAVNAPPPSVK